MKKHFYQLYNIMIRYIHGSQDSLDLDVVYVFDTMPTFMECQEFCRNDDENRNIITIQDGIVNNCFKGSIDEINNSLLRTYYLHKQDYDLLITRPVTRDVITKLYRVIRIIISYYTKTIKRAESKYALNSFLYNDKLNFILSLIYNNMYVTDGFDFGKNNNKNDVYKTFAFQLGQIMGLLEGIELYTKKEIVEYRPALYPYIYRCSDNVIDLTVFMGLFYNTVKNFNIEQQEDYVIFKDYNTKIDMKNGYKKDLTF